MIQFGLRYTVGRLFLGMTGALYTQPLQSPRFIDRDLRLEFFVGASVPLACISQSASHHW